MNRLLRPVPLVALVGVLALLALLAFGLASQGSSSTIDSQLKAGKRPAAPASTFDELDGSGKVALSSYHGKVVVLNFWASWCEPCRAESPLLERWHKRISARGGTVLGVDVLDVTSDAREFIRQYKLSYPMLRDADGETQRNFGVAAYPETLVLDRDGRVAAVRRGPVDEEFMRREVAPLLEERA